MTKILVIGPLELHCVIMNYFLAVLYEYKLRVDV